MDVSGITIIASVVSTFTLVSSLWKLLSNFSVKEELENNIVEVEITEKDGSKRVLVINPNRTDAESLQLFINGLGDLDDVADIELAPTTSDHHIDSNTEIKHV